MTTQELHINIDLLLQKVSSNWNSNFLPQEKDIFINKEILKFVKQRINPLSNIKLEGSYDTIKRTQDINVLTKTVPLNVIDLNPKEAIVQLPFDFLYYVSGSLDVCCNCSNINISTFTKYIATFSPIDDSVEELSNEILIQLDTQIQGEDIIDLVDTINLPENYFPNDNLPNYRKYFIYNNLIFNSIKRNLPIGYEVKYDKFSNKFIISSNTPFEIIFSMGEIDFTINYTQEINNTYNLTNSLEAELRVIDEEFKTHVKKSYLSGNKDESRIGYLRNNSIILPKSPNVILDTLDLTYRCYPSKVDVLLQYNSELTDEALDEVINNVAQKLKGVISDDGYEKFIRENLLIE